MGEYSSADGRAGRFFGPVFLGAAMITAVVLWRVLPPRQAPPPAIVETALSDAPAALPEGLAEGERKTISLFEGAQPSVVYITNVALRRTSWFSRNVTEIPQGTGSGFVWDDQGHVVTNFHVIQGASAARVTLHDQTTWDAKLVGVAPDKDLAVLRIDAPKEKLRPLKVGRSKALRVGQSVYAIGNPFGFDYTLTTGVISGLGREIQSVTRRPIQDVIQTDAAINPGNSGGPLLNSSGELIGVNTSIYSPSGAYAGIGFAVPVDTVNWIVPQLIQHGRVQRPGLGVTIAAPQVAARLGVRKGLLVVDVIPKGAADKAGLKPTLVDRQGNVKLGDVLLSVDGNALADNDDLYRVLDRKRVGTEVLVQVFRDGRSQKLPLTLQGLKD
jgi:S1-C subfamily serine protease